MKRKYFTMTRLIFLCLFLSLNFLSFSQSTIDYYKTYQDAIKYRKAGDIESAITELNKLLTLKEKTVLFMVYNELANCYYAKGDYENTKKSYINALGCDDTSLLTIERLCFLYILFEFDQNVLINEGLQYSLKAEKLNSENPYIYFLLSCIFSIKNDMGKSISYMDKSFYYFYSSVDIKQELDLIDTFSFLENFRKTPYYKNLFMNKDQLLSAYDNYNNAERNIKNDDFEKALSFYQSCENNIVKSLGQKSRWLSFIYTKYSEIYEKLKNNEKIIFYMQKALEIDEYFDDRKNIAYTLSAIGYYYLSVKNSKSAIEYYKKSLDINLVLGNKKSIANNYDNLGYSYMIDLDYRKSIEFYEKALILHKDLQNKKNIAFDYRYIGDDYYNLKLFTDSVSYYKKSLDESMELNDKIFTSDGYMKLAIAYYSLKDYENSIEQYKKSLSLEGESGDKKIIAYIYQFLGENYCGLKNYNLGIQYFEKSLNIYNGLKDKNKTTEILLSLANAYKLIFNFEKSLKYCEDALSIYRQLSDNENIADVLLDIGNIYQSINNYKEALKYYNDSLTIYKDLGNKNKIAIIYNNIGHNYNKTGEMETSIDYYFKSLAISQELSDKNTMSITLSNIGTQYSLLGEYDIALKYLIQSLEINKELNDKLSEAYTNNNIGQIYASWGKYDKSLDYFDMSLKLFEDLKNDDEISIALNNIGVVYQTEKKYDKAFEYFNKSLKITQKTNSKLNMILCMNNFGVNYRYLNQNDKALEYFNRALDLAAEINDKYSLSNCLNNISDVYSSNKDYKKALEYQNKALKLAEDLKDRSLLALCLNNMGINYLYLKDFQKSIDCLNKSIMIIEQLRLTATGDIRRDYLAAQIRNYRNLISAHINNNSPGLALNTKEQSSSKYLIEQISAKLNEKNFNFSGVSNYQKTMDNKTVIIDYSITNFDDVIVFVLDKKSINAVKVNSKDFIDRVYGKLKIQIESYDKKISRGFKKNNEDPVQKETLSLNLEKIINYYRSLLTNPKKCVVKTDAKTDFEIISNELYNFLINPIEGNLKDRRNVIIVPDDILGFLPFEVLIQNDRKFFIEKYNIRYLQSLAIDELINKRKYADNRKQFIGFGGGIYEESTYNEEMANAIDNEKKLNNLENKTLTAMTEGKSTRSAYEQLGYGLWGNLPGTLNEVVEIKKIIKDAVIYTKDLVEESNIKKMSKTGDLKKYKIVHFATHGLVIPEFPELSAIVLSQFEKEKYNEDGYLRMKEISELDLNADFVNLSACETGLGKIYGGEGIVGLTQSFLVAGSNGLSVSLWQVSDESTMEFMKGMYDLIQNKKISFSDAICEMKRKFILSSNYKEPFFWAPFVYYGK